MSSLNTIPKFFYDENFKLDSEYKIDYYNLLYGDANNANYSTTVGDKTVGILYLLGSTDTISMEYTYMIGQNIVKYISQS